MNSVDRMREVCNQHHYYVHGSREYFPTHALLDLLDKKLGVDTRGGVRHDPCCGQPHGQPMNYVGTRLRLHEEYIRKDVPPNYDEWQQANESYMWGIHNPWF